MRTHVVEVWRVDREPGAGVVGVVAEVLRGRDAAAAREPGRRAAALRRAVLSPHNAITYDTSFVYLIPNS